MSGDQIEFNLRIKLMREALNRWQTPAETDYCMHHSGLRLL